jgi:hypothetical protein
MIRHIVCWKLVEENKTEHAQKIQSMLQNLVGQVPGLLRLEVGINLKEAPDDNWDVVLNSDFESMAALDAYQVHSLHKEAAAFIITVRTNRVCVDYLVK